MSRLQTLVERAIARLKGDRGYRMESQYSARQLSTVLWHRAMQLLRGVALRLHAPHVHGTVFCGRRVVVEHARQLSAGPSLILEDGVYINALSFRGIALGRNVTVGRGASLMCTGVIADIGVGIRTGDRCAIGAGSFLGGQGGITIGDDVILGPAVRLVSENHVFSDPGKPIRTQGVTRRGIAIGSNCWIGAGATILDGVSIGSGCVVGAGAVVTINLLPFTTAAGVPARVIRSRVAPSRAEDALPARQASSTDSRERSPSWPETEGSG